MKFVCDRCQTKYSIADERVRGKVLKVKCKTCANLITVREAKRPTTGGLSPLGHAGGGPAAASHGAAPEEADWNDSARTILSPYADLPVEARPPVPPRRPTGPVATVPPAAPDDGVQWYMALDGHRSGPFTRKQLVDKLAPLPRQADVHVWNEKLGAWKPPADVPAVAADITARRRPPTLPPGAPPRRATPAPPPAPPIGGPPPGAPGRRPTTGPIAALGASGIRLPLPSHAPGPKPVDLFAPAISTRGDDPGSLLQTPAPHPAHGPGGTNGVGASNGSIESLTGRGAIQSSSDVLKLLNLPGASQASGAKAPTAPPPRLMTGSEAVGWSPSTGAHASRTKNARLIFALLGIVAVVCVVVTLSIKKTKPPAVVAPKGTVTDPLAAVVEKANEPTPPEAAPTAPTAPPSPAGAGRGGRPTTRGQHGRAAPPTGPTTPPPLPGAPTAPGVAATPQPEGGSAARFRDGGRNVNVPSIIANRPPPSQGDISRVISSNRNGIKTCYQRALLRDSSLTHGKVTVKLTIGISGRVKHVGVDGPTQFRAVEPCMRDVVSHWSFPQASEEYGTEFVYVFQGNE